MLNAIGQRLHVQFEPFVLRKPRLLPCRPPARLYRRAYCCLPMHLHLIRTLLLPHASIGTLSVDGAPFCQVSESTGPAAAQLSARCSSVLPLGTYEVILSYSTRFRQILPLLLDVATHEDVRIRPGPAADHPGEGLLVGWYDAPQQAWVGSEPLYAVLFARLRAARDADQPIRLTIAERRRRIPLNALDH